MQSVKLYCRLFPKNHIWYCILVARANSSASISIKEASCLELTWKFTFWRNPGSLSKLPMRDASTSSTIWCRMLSKIWSVSCYCVLIVYCVLNNNTFKLFLIEHMFSEWLFLLEVIRYRNYLVNLLQDAEFVRKDYYYP